MSNYFSYLPNVFVRTDTYRQNSNDPYVLAKNIFRRIAIRKNLEDAALGFIPYSIPHNTRPDQVAEEAYNDAQLDWIVLLVNNIINIYDEWPMYEQELFNYCMRKYNGDINAIHHYETLEQKKNGIVTLSAGIEVSSNFEYVFPDGTVPATDNLITAVTNYEYEVTQNDYKRNIYLLRTEYVDDFIEEFEILVDYDPNEEVDIKGRKKSTNIIAEQFNSTKKTFSSDIGRQPSITFASGTRLTGLSTGGSSSTDNNAPVEFIEVTPSTSVTGTTVTTGTGSTGAGSSGSGSSGSGGSGGY